MSLWTIPSRLKSNNWNEMNYRCRVFWFTKLKTSSEPLLLIKINQGHRTVYHLLLFSDIIYCQEKNIYQLLDLPTSFSFSSLPYFSRLFVFSEGTPLILGGSIRTWTKKRRRKGRVERRGSGSRNRTRSQDRRERRRRSSGYEPS